MQIRQNVNTYFSSDFDWPSFIIAGLLSFIPVIIIPPSPQAFCPHDI